MNKIEPKLIEYLSDFTLYPNEAPASASYPFVVYSITGDIPDETFEHSASTTRETITLDYHAATYGEAREGADLLELEMLAFTGATVFSQNPSSDKTDKGFYFSRDFDVAYDRGSPFPSTSNGICWFDRNQKVYADTAGTVKAGIGERVARWNSIGGDWGNRYAIQNTAGARPRLSSKGVEAYMDTLPVSLPASTHSGKYFNLNATMSLAGNFTLYSIHYAAVHPVEPYAGIVVLGGQVAYPHWYYQPAQYLNYGSGWFYYSRFMGYGGHYSTEGWNIDTPYIMCRVRRNYTGGLWRTYLQWTNTSERYTATNDGWTFPFNYLMHGGINPTQAPPSGFHLKQLVIVNEDTVLTGADEAIRNKLFELEGITL